MGNKLLIYSPVLPFLLRSRAGLCAVVAAAWTLVTRGPKIQADSAPPNSVFLISSVETTHHVPGGNLKEAFENLRFSDGGLISCWQPLLQEFCWAETMTARIERSCGPGLLGPRTGKEEEDGGRLCGSGIQPTNTFENIKVWAPGEDLRHASLCQNRRKR